MAPPTSSNVIRALLVQKGNLLRRSAYHDKGTPERSAIDFAMSEIDHEIAILRARLAQRVPTLPAVKVA